MSAPPQTPEQQHERTIIPSAEAPTNNNRQLRHVRARDSAHHLRAILRDAATLRFGADHVP